MTGINFYYFKGMREIKEEMKKKSPLNPLNIIQCRKCLVLQWVGVEDTEYSLMVCYILVEFVVVKTAVTFIGYYA